MKNNKQYLNENLVKNIVLLFISIIAYPLILQSLMDAQVEKIPDILMIISILLVFGAAVNFAFTYAQVDLKSAHQRFLGHMTTFIAMLLIFILLETIMICVSIAYPSITTLSVVVVLLTYLCVVLYDFTDLLKNSEF